MLRRIARSIPLLALLFTPAPAAAQTSVYVVRHAEKVVTEKTDDPPLTDAGRARAKELARVLADVKLAAVYTTKYARNVQTAEPTAKAQGIVPKVVEAKDADGLAKRLRADHRGQRVLVVGHSNTVPELLTALGVADAITLTDSDYDNLFVVMIDERGRARLERLHFGAH